LDYAFRDDLIEPMRKVIATLAHLAGVIVDRRSVRLDGRRPNEEAALILAIVTAERRRRVRFRQIVRFQADNSPHEHGFDVARIAMGPARREREIAETAETSQALHLIGDGADVAIGAVERPIAVDEEPFVER